MSELWIPQPDKHPDVTNLYDMMLVFQEQLDLSESYEARVASAKLALRALAYGLKSLSDEERQVSMVTDLAVIDSTENPGKGTVAEHVGLRGFVDDVHCINIGERLPLSVSLGIDVVSMFPPDAPDEDDIVLSNAKTPINHVHHIETIAC